MGDDRPMKSVFITMMLLMGGWTHANEQGALQGSSLDTVCSSKNVSASNRPPIDTKTIHYKNKALVLTYHHLDEKESFITITPVKFKQHLQALKDNHYNVVSVEDYACFQAKRRMLPPNAVVITFDDGYRSFYEKAYPILKQMGYPATNFVIVSDVDSDYPSLPFLTWNQIREMKRDGYSFYSHTYDLHQKRKDEAGNGIAPLPNRVFLPKEQRMEIDAERKQRVRTDLLRGEAYLKMKLDNKLSMLCFPMGEYNKTVVEEAKPLGFSLFFTTKEGINNGSSREVNRVSAGMPYVSGDVLMKKLAQYDQK